MSNGHSKYEYKQLLPFSYKWPTHFTAGNFQKHYLTAGSIMYKEGQRKKIDLMENSLAEQMFTFTVAL